MLHLRSRASDRQLLIKAVRAGSFLIELVGHPVQAQTQAWVEMESDSFADFFCELARSERPWEGERKWWSMEGELAIAATCSSLGVVVFQVTLCGMQGAPEEWRVRVGIEAELGQLTGLAEEARALVLIEGGHAV